MAEIAKNPSKSQSGGTIPAVGAARAGFTEAANAPRYKAPPLPIDPAKPISSLGKGKQQFTVALDTEHGDASIINALTAEIPALAASGHKHLIFELGQPTAREEIEAAYPQIKGKSIQDSLDFLLDMHKNLKEQTPKDKEQISQIAKNIVDIYKFDILQRVNAKPPQITEQEINNNFFLFTSVHDTSIEQSSGKARAKLIAEAMKAGIQIHYAGDYPGEDHHKKWKEYSKQCDDHDIKITDFRKSNAELEKPLEEYRSLGEEGYAAKLKSQGMVDQEILDKLKDIKTYDQTLDKLYREGIELQNLCFSSHGQWIAARFSDQALEGRAQRFIDLAKGEKAVVLWGQHHFSNNVNPKDVNEYLDEKLRAQALKNGTLNQFVPTKTIEINVSRGDYEKDKTHHTAQIEQPNVRMFVQEKQVEIPDAHKDDYTLASPAAPAHGGPVKPR